MTYLDRLKHFCELLHHSHNWRNVIYAQQQVPDIEGIAPFLLDVRLHIKGCNVGAEPDNLEDCAEKILDAIGQAYSKAINTHWEDKCLSSTKP